MIIAGWHHATVTSSKKCLDTITTLARKLARTIAVQNKFDQLHATFCKQFGIAANVSQPVLLRQLKKLLTAYIYGM